MTNYSEQFAALADPTRRRIFESLAGRPQSVGELAAPLPVTRPAVSQHLKVLMEAGLVSVTRAGRRRIYHLEPSALARLHDYFDTFWFDTLAAFKETAEAGSQAPD